MSNTPDIRFKGFTDPWVQHKVGDFTSVLSASRVHKDEWETDGIPFFRSSDVVSAFKGSDNERAYISQELYEKLIKSSGKLEKGDILITGGGSIGIPYIVPDNAPLYTKDADLIWIKKSSNHNSRYLYTYFTGMQFRDYISSISHVGTIAHYTIEQVKDTPVLMPKMAEQKAIGNFLLHIDYLITLHQRECDEMSELKKFMLQKMFPKNGEQFPEIRFSGYTAPWEPCKVSDIVNICSGRDYKHLGQGDIPVYGTGGYMVSVDDALSYDIDAIGIGRKGTIDKPYILRAPFWTVDTLFYAVPTDPENLDFAYDIFQCIDWKKKDESTGVPSLSKEAINRTAIMVPNSEEQKKIGSYFSNIDTLITLYQRKRDELKDFKKFMLQNMFPKKG